MASCISLNITAEGKTNKVSFQSEKRDGKVFVKFYLGQECIGEMELAMEDFNNFCLDILSLQKEINK